MGLYESCHGGCCRSFAVPVTGADIIHIERKLGLSFWNFVCLWADHKGDIARNYAPYFFFKDELETPFVICLMHEESHFLPGSTKCRFLVECPADEHYPLGLARCGIYHERPSAYRTFPTKLNDTGELVVIHDVPERGRSRNNPAYELCPRQWDPEDVDPIGSLQDLVAAKHEMAFFQNLSNLWNRNPQLWNVFSDFLHLVYSSRVLCESDDYGAEIEPATIRIPQTSDDDLWKRPEDRGVGSFLRGAVA